MAFGDRLFWGIMVFIGVNLLWLGLVEQYLSQWLGAVLGLAGCLATIRFVPPPKTEESVNEE